MSNTNNLPPLFAKFSLMYDQGPASAQMQFVLICQHIPVGSYVSMSADVPGPQPPIDLPPTEVTDGQYFQTGVASNVPSNYQSIIEVSLFSDHKMPTDSSISFQASYINGPITGLSPNAAIVVKEVTFRNS